MPHSLIACRTTAYGPFEHLAFEHLAGLGIGHVEVLAPPPDQSDQLRADLERWGLRASTVHAPCDLTRDDVADQIAAQMPLFSALGTRLMFVAVKMGTVPFKTACDRLRTAGEVAAEHGVTIVVETHPDLATNGEIALCTMQTVDHPNVRINFDTANIYFYNHDTDAARELRTILPYVAAVHLKDTDGGYRHWHFPALGRGVVNFPKVFGLLDSAGFNGPCTLEIEGIEGEQRTERLVCDRIAESLGYLRGLGRL
ncbi:MAG: sugar phosphate isomerase/epimerase family protein [Phycisphaerae bacterium]|jgi:sugar phosphate isomerase/epimerase